MVQVTPSLKRRFITGTAWMVALRWMLKGIGLVNTAILGRLLSPEDFGLIAMATVAIGFIEIWFAAGVDTALIRTADVTKDDYDTAWTLRIVQAVCVALISVGIAPWAAEYFRDPRVVPLMWLFAFAAIVTGSSNIGIVEFRKELNFHREFIFSIASRLAGLVITITLAALWLDYWALAVGLLAQSLVEWLLSYGMHPHRPRFSLSRFASLWGFSRWMIVVNTAVYFTAKIDEFFAARLGSSAGFGIYSVASDLGQIPTTELSTPVSRTLVPLLAQLQDSSARMWNAYHKATACVNTATLPAGIGMAIVAPQLVPLFLGNKWVEAVPYVQLFGVYGVIRGLFFGGYSLLTVLGRLRVQAALLWAEVALLLLACGLGGYWYGMMGIAAARLIVAVVIGFAMFAIIRVVAPEPPPSLVHHMIRPLVACLMMVVAILSLPPALDALPLAALLIKVLVGLVVYSGALLAIWTVSGRPDGAERMCLSAMQQVWGGVRKAPAP